MITVHSHGIHYRWLKDAPKELMDQIRLAHDLREDFVSLELEYEETKKNIWSSYPQIEQIETDLAAAEQTAADIAAQVKAARVTSRSKKGDPQLTADLKAARAAVKDLKAFRREAISAARADAKPQLQAATQALFEARKTLYRQYCTNGDLFWATHNATLDHHKTAVKLVDAKRAKGEPASLRHHRFDGSGTIAVQLQRANGQPQRTPAMIADGQGGTWRNVLHIPGWIEPQVWETMTRAQQRAAGRVTIRMRCGKGWIEVPVQMSQMLPADADITGARLTLRRVGSQLRGAITVTAKIPDPQPITDGPTVALHTGWHRSEDGITVATWRSSAPLEIPADMASFMPADPGALSGRVVLPYRLLDRLELHAEQDSGRDLAFSEARETLAAWLDEHGPLAHPYFDDVTLTRSVVTKWRNPVRLARCVNVWRQDTPASMDELVEDLETWRASDKRAWDNITFGRRKALAFRTDLYRQVASTIALQASTLLTDRTAIATLAKQPTDLPNEVEAKIARQRANSAPGELRAACAAAAKREGLAIIEIDSAGLSRIHAGCGHENPVTKNYQSRRITCDGCGLEYDTEANATQIMLARAA